MAGEPSTGAADVTSDAAQIVFVILLAMPTQENPQLLETLQYRAFAAKVGAERRLDHTV